MVGGQGSGGMEAEKSCPSVGVQYGRAPMNGLDRVWVEPRRPPTSVTAMRTVLFAGSQAVGSGDSSESE